MTDSNGSIEQNAKKGAAAKGSEVGVGKLLWIAAAIIAIGAAYVAAARILTGSFSESGALGDSVAPITSLLTVGALVMTIRSVSMQKQELQLQRLEMAEQREVLKDQAAAQKEQAQAQQRMERAYLLLATTMQLSEMSSGRRHLMDVVLAAENAKSPQALENIKNLLELSKVDMDTLQALMDETTAALKEAKAELSAVAVAKSQK